MTPGVVIVALLAVTCWALAEWHAWWFPNDDELEDEEVDDDDRA